MTQYFLGIDTGATKSHALIADEHGRVLGFGESGPGNWEVVGWAGMQAVLDGIIGQATAQAGITCAQIAGAGLGLAGYDWPEDRPPHETIIGQLLPGVPFALVNDAFLGLPAGTDAGWGVVVGAGTSCNATGRNPQGQMGRITGSSRFGEYAGSGELVLFALQAVSRAWSRRGPETALSAAFCTAVSATDVPDLLAGLMRDRYHMWAEKAPVVFATAAAGDAVALDLVRWAGHSLGDLACGIIRQVGIAEMSFDVVLAGSFYKGSPLVQECMAETIHVLAPRARLVHLDAPPVIGAVLLGMEQVGVATAVARRVLVDEMKLRNS
ncbi:MAG TPA: BadF/BadG/BcrA/BcrD ATPase family protein [Chloroflexota bacterium]|nr:BadF/BadG/BcrA/BcrD ATPase family protein [Chloroflexota bacterium]